MENKFLNSIGTDNKSGWKRILSFLGPAYLVSVGYMDPGNWATDIAAGSKFGYTLIWVIVVSNITAILVQSHSARFGIVTGKDIAQFSRGYYPKFLNFIYWIFAEIAIAATDLAEILGMAIGLKLLFGLNMLIGVTLSLFDTFIIMFLIKKGVRTLEAIIIGLISIIGISFSIELFLSKPAFSEIVKGIIPVLPNNEALYIAIGIIGATVMPHNLYLHSSLVQTRKFTRDNAGKSKALKYNVIDTVIALNLALFVNAAILILASATFFKTGHHEVEDIINAHKMLAPLLGTLLAPLLFAIALIASGQSSTLTGTLTGQIIMEGYLNIRLAPWLRRLITRLMAVIPAFIVILIAGESYAGSLLILSQVILSMQLGFAVIPLLHWVSSKTIMGEYRISIFSRIVSWIVILGIVTLNIKMVFDSLIQWLGSSAHPWLFFIFVVIPVGISFSLLLYTIIEPFIKLYYVKDIMSPHEIAPDFVLDTPKPFKRIGIGVDFSSSDIHAINHAIKLGSKNTEFFLIHVVESAVARAMNTIVSDNETQKDSDSLQAYALQMKQQGFNAFAQIGFGSVENKLPEILKERDIELLVLASHRKGWLHRLFKGTIINKVQKSVAIPVYIVK